MLSEDKLKRIGELSRLSKERTLTDDEKEEQKILREEYLQVFRSNFRTHLHQIKVVDSKGNDVTPEKLKKSKLLKEQN